MNGILKIIAVLIIGLVNLELAACSCRGESTVYGAVKKSDIVVSGQIISIEKEWFLDATTTKNNPKVDSLNYQLNGYHLSKVQILVSELYKGKIVNDTIVIYTGIGGGDCGYRFKKGMRYIVYGTAESYFGTYFKNRSFPMGQDIYWTNICTRTQQYSSLEIEALERMKK